MPRHLTRERIQERPAEGGFEGLDYDLPSERIAQEPADPRDSSRLLVIDRTGGRIVHSRFHRIGEFLRPGDLLVVNDARVIAGRFEGRKPSGGRVEITLLEDAPPGSGPLGGAERLALVRCFSGRLDEGTTVLLEAGAAAVVRGIEESGRAWLEFRGVDPLDYAARRGRMPLPPYIRRRSDGSNGSNGNNGNNDEVTAARDAESYQTVYATEPGAAAAPTAGLHFTRGLLGKLCASGIEVAKITLHVGYGTFAPVRARRIEEHRMHREFFRIGREAAEAIARARARDGRVVAVGTTTVRALESACRPGGIPEAGEGWTQIFIRPGHRFRCLDALVTNFHQPRTTPLALVAAFAGARRVGEAYRDALREGYRFLSYGDAMLVQ